MTATPAPVSSNAFIKFLALLIGFDFWGVKPERIEGQIVQGHILPAMPWMITTSNNIDGFTSVPSLSMTQMPKQYVLVFRTSPGECNVITDKRTYRRLMRQPGKPVPLNVWRGRYNPDNVKIEIAS